MTLSNLTPVDRKRGRLDPSLPPGYHLERNPDLLLLRRPWNTLRGRTTRVAQASRKGPPIAGTSDRAVL